MVIHALVIAALSWVSNVVLPQQVWLPLLWPAAGMGFSLLATRGHTAVWSLGLGAALWSAVTHPESLAMIPVVAVATCLGQWLAWKRLQVRFAGTSQPFARMITVLAFLRVQGMLAAPVSSLVLTMGWGVLHPHTTPQHLLWLWCLHWALLLASAVLALHALFAMGFLQLRERQPLLWRLHQALLVALALNLPLMVTLGIEQGLMGVSALYFPLALYTGVHAVRTRVPGAPLYVLGMLASAFALRAGAAA